MAGHGRGQCATRTISTAALPGGWALIEEPDYITEAIIPNGDSAAEATFRKVTDAKDSSWPRTGSTMRLRGWAAPVEPLDKPAFIHREPAVWRRRPSMQVGTVRNSAPTRGDHRRPIGEHGPRAEISAGALIGA